MVQGRLDGSQIVANWIGELWYKICGHFLHTIYSKKEMQPASTDFSTTTKNQGHFALSSRTIFLRI